MKISNDEYLFIEWVILNQHLTEQQFSNLTNAEYLELLSEYRKFVASLN